MKRWLPLILLPLGVFGATILCLWLAQSLMGREHRLAERQALVLHAEAVGARFQSQLSWLRGFAAIAAPRLPADASPDTIKAEFQRIEALAGSGSVLPQATQPQAAQASFVTGLVMVASGTKRVLASNVGTIAEGQPLTDAVMLNTVGRGGAAPAAGSRVAVDVKKLDAPDASAWLTAGRSGRLSVLSAPPALSDDPVDLLIRIDLKRFAQTALGQMPVLADESAYKLPERQPELRLEALTSTLSSRPQGRGDIQSEIQFKVQPVVKEGSVVANQLTLPLAGFSPELQAQMTQPLSPVTDVTGPLALRLLIGSSLLSLILMAAWWRWQTVTGAGQIPRRLAATLRAVARGDLNQRSGLSPKDDPQACGRALDDLLDQHNTMVSAAHAEQQDLEYSVAKLQDAITVMASGRDLTRRVSSSSDLIGSVAEAVNNLREQTVTVMSSVSDSSLAVSEGVAQLGVNASRFDELGRQLADRLQAATQQMTSIFGQLSAVVNDAPQINASIDKSRVASDESIAAARKTLTGLTQARTQIRLTEKRVKGLGERSQEIGGLVRGIGELAERTGILALNASLQAAAAGPEGKLLAPIAQEVKRLADSAGEAADQAASLVNAIRDETIHASAAMNAAITEVVQVTEQAKAVGKYVVQVGAAVTTLADDVTHLGNAEARQAEPTRLLHDGVQAIGQATDELIAIMNAQVAAAHGLQAHARNLFDQASAFRLPLTEQSTGEPEMPELLKSATDTDRLAGKGAG